MANSLPEEIKTDIFLRLPAQYISPSSRVCKTWRRLLRSTDFVDTHLRSQLQQQQDPDDDLYHKGSNNGGGKLSFLFLVKSYLKSEDKSICYGEYYNASLNYKTIRKSGVSKKIKTSKINQDLSNRVDSLKLHAIVGSCNGLICLSLCHNLYTFINDPVYIINPITGEEMNLPKFIGNGQRQCVSMASGFGYLPSTNEYKVVRITYSTARPSSGVGQVEVYTLSGGIGSGWRDKGEIFSYLLRSHLSSSQGVLADGALHWFDHRKLRILAFDLAQEEFFEVPPPPCFLPEERLFLHLRVLGGCLSVVHQMRGGRVDIWSFKMKKEKMNSSDGTKEQDSDCCWSWSKEFSIASEGKCHGQYDPFALTRSGEVLLWHNRTILSVYDPKTAKLKKLEDNDLGLKVIQGIPHVNSFVSLKALGEGLI